jgi:transposase
MQHHVMIESFNRKPQETAEIIAVLPEGVECRARRCAMLVDLPFLYVITDFDREVFRRFVAPDHPLVVAEREIDWEGLRPVVEAAYCPDRGQPAIDPLRMLKLEFLRYWNNLSDRQVMQRIKTDLAYRYFLQVGYKFQPPDSSSLCYFRARLGEEGFVKLFDQTLAQARRAGLVKDRLRLKDASHVVASIAVPTTLTLVAEVRDRLLAASEPFDSVWVSGQRMEVNLLRERTKEQSVESRLSARVTHLQELVAWAERWPMPVDCATNAATGKAWQKFQETLELARKILQDRQPHADHKTLSVHDPEARRGKHGDYYEGYLVDILMDADSGLLTQINVLAAGGEEARDAVDLVRAEQAAHGNQIEGLSIDGAGFSGPMLRELEGPAQREAAAATATEAAAGPPAAAESPGDEQAGLGVTVYVPPKAEPAGGRFPSADFILNEEKTAVTCPAGKTSQYQQRDPGRHANIFRFTAATCQACPLRRQCVAKPGTGAFGRSVTKNDYEPEYARARQRAQTTEFAAVRREHPAVERKLNELLNHHRGRRARYWGRAKIHIQELMTGFVVNTKRMLTLMAQLRAEETATASAAT